ncbi:hypothetical protein MKW98_021843 [Papaver atlanticum]|uniref:Uncharacterized protein n=1 Tax=Papaver atlanticum TaxID=357466 RepID=A0AAD4SFE3_9MAGN|nr:hypothetical protein MKW98_021843 [Papaver atlanticum]
MTEVERKVLLEKHRSAYRNRKSRIGCGHTAETREQLPTTTQFRPQDPEVGTSTTTTLQVSNSNGEHKPNQVMVNQITVAKKTSILKVIW